MIVNFVVSFIMAVATFNIWHNINSSNRINWKSKRTWIYIIAVSLVTILNFYVINNFFRIVNMTLFFIFIYKFYYELELKESIVCPVISQFLYLVSETIFIIFILLLHRNNIDNFMSNYLCTVFTNIVICIIAFLISKFKIIKILFERLNIFISSFDEIKTIIFICIIMLMFSVLSINSYNHMNPISLMISTILIIVFTTILLFIYYKAKAEYYKINDKYNSSLLSLKELEKAIMNHRIDNHENRNQLLTIRNMTKSKKIISFIDSILDNKVEDDKRIMKETSIIPSGGLRGLIYSKLLLMNNKKIEYELDISNSVRIVDMINYDDNLMIDICKIIGIFLDNAIEEVENLDDKYISIEMYMDNNNLVISITNTFDNSKDKTNIFKAGFSTKGENHGYGLTLVKKIVKNNAKLETYNEITEEEFTQLLIIK